MKRIFYLAVFFFCISGHVFAQETASKNIVVQVAVTGKPAVKKVPAPKRPVLVREIVNFHMITPRIMRGSQPKDKAFEILKEYAGVKTIIDLRHEKEQIEKERKIVTGLGMTFISIPMRGIQKQTPATIDKVLDIITDKSKQPVFVHCEAGKDRTGMIIAAYRIKYDHWSQDDAVKEMLAYGYDRGSCSAMEKSLTQWKGQLKK